MPKHISYWVFTKRRTQWQNRQEQEQIDTTVGHVVGAIYALKAGILGEFSDAGDTGIVEVRVENGKIPRRVRGEVRRRQSRDRPRHARGLEDDSRRHRCDQSGENLVNVRER
jgi:hypothetical protein